MKKIIAVALNCFVIAGLLGAAQLSFSTPAEARRGIGHINRPAVRHINRSKVVRVNRRVHVTNVNVRHRNYRYARRVATGVAVGVAVSSVARYNYSCSNLLYYCNRGQGWACSEYERRCY